MDTYIKNTDLKPIALPSSPGWWQLQNTTIQAQKQQEIVPRTSKMGRWSLYRERERGSTFKTHERHYLYTEDTVNSQKGWARDGFELRWLVGWNKDDIARQSTRTSDDIWLGVMSSTFKRKCSKCRLALSWCCPGFDLCVTLIFSALLKSLLVVLYWLEFLSF